MKNLKTIDNKTKLILALVLIAIGVSGRLLPHLWNFTPIIAIALFAGVYMGKKYAVFLPLTIMLIGDIFIGFDHLAITISIYGSIALAGLLAYGLRRYKSFRVVAGITVASSIMFFLITNAAVWVFSPLYTPNFSGLMQSYVMGIPFFRNSLIGNLFYTGILFGVYELATFRSRYKTGLVAKNINF
ncbi:MAG: DUF6580 family putative transport protein [Candidatus Saccharimonadales bacterium]